MAEEHASGGDRDRPVLARTLACFQLGDTLMVVSLDRLARSLSHLLEVILGVQVLGSAAQLERALIRERNHSGMRAAATRGSQPSNPGLRAGTRPPTSPSWSPAPMPSCRPCSGSGRTAAPGTMSSATSMPATPRARRPGPPNAWSGRCGGWWLRAWPSQRCSPRSGRHQAPCPAAASLRLGAISCSRPAWGPIPSVAGHTASAPLPLPCRPTRPHSVPSRPVSFPHPRDRLSVVRGPDAPATPCSRSPAARRWSCR
ncbi:recombinase family protein [Paracraurococcus lichenis]|uniref:recombinase family protein n=1 Tax=Paracraurococcus lichenis TaxID=3064888 RepID=UPI0038CFE515